MDGSVPLQGVSCRSQVVLQTAPGTDFPSSSIEGTGWCFSSSFCLLFSSFLPFQVPPFFFISPFSLLFLLLPCLHQRQKDNFGEDPKTSTSSTPGQCLQGCCCNISNRLHKIHMGVSSFLILGRQAALETRGCPLLNLLSEKALPKWNN